MAEKRRGRGSGSSPGGRSSSRSTRAERDRRAPASKAVPEVAEREVPIRASVRKSSRSSAPKPERTILGLSTGRAVILAVVVCALALTLAVPLRTYFTQRGDAAQVEAQRVDLEADLQKLREKKLQQADPAYITAEARDRLRLVMPGETPFQVQLPGAYEAEQARMAKPEPKGGPWYSDLWKQVSVPAPAPVPPPAMPLAPLPPPPPSAGGAQG
ncbi:FtsB family cell division protein [Antrihabitans cavernicola]|uniref:Septum formation initiator family protein n=1 Tax=Antrihabitans cavernicola TaxID=2495913 RepID=A0A5A7SD81_9NOCA|nr:septum formation initiator family protein [Spelaeibacter cavernicola]KAA0023876.1 septum formation initiator family protein [Spelaeibacter cavernicola]